MTDNFFYIFPVTSTGARISLFEEVRLSSSLTV